MMMQASVLIEALPIQLYLCSPPSRIQCNNMRCSRDQTARQRLLNLKPVRVCCV